MVWDEIYELIEKTNDETNTEKRSNYIMESDREIVRLREEIVNITRLITGLQNGAEAISAGLFHDERPDVRVSIGQNPMNSCNASSANRTICTSDVETDTRPHSKIRKMFVECAEGTLNSMTTKWRHQFESMTARDIAKLKMEVTRKKMRIATRNNIDNDASVIFVDECRRSAASNVSLDTLNSSKRPRESSDSSLDDTTTSNANDNVNNTKPTTERRQTNPRQAKKNKS